MKLGASARIETFIELEQAVWQALMDGDAAADARLLSDDFVGVYATGIATKGDHLAQLHNGPSVARYAMFAPKMRVLAESVVALSYLVRWERAPIADDGALESMYVTSIWRLERGAWVNVFSQDTDARS